MTDERCLSIRIDIQNRQPIAQRKDDVLAIGMDAQAAGDFAVEAENRNRFEMVHRRGVAATAAATAAITAAAAVAAATGS